MKIWVTLLCVSWMVMGCAAVPKQTRDLQKSIHEFPESHVIEGVPFVNQSDNYCGPASLAMVMQWHGVDVTMDEIAKSVFTPGKQGSFQTDMISAGRRQGMMAVKIEGMRSLLSEVTKNHPVIVFENLAFDNFPMWHYAVVFGYDLKNEKIILHTGDQKHKIWDMERFERAWIPADYWGLVLVPAGKIVESAGELANATAAAALQVSGKKAEAEKSYQAILFKWPANQVALIGMANVEFERKNFNGAISYLTKGTEAYPESAIFWHNRALAEQAARKLKVARQSAKKALQFATVENRTRFETSLKDLLQN